MIYQSTNYLEHHGVLGQKWGVRRYQNEDGTLTEAEKKRYRYNSNNPDHSAKKYLNKASKASKRVKEGSYGLEGSLALSGVAALAGGPYSAILVGTGLSVAVINAGYTAINSVLKNKNLNIANTIIKTSIKE